MGTRRFSGSLLGKQKRNISCKEKLQLATPNYSNPSNPLVNVDDAYTRKAMIRSKPSLHAQYPSSLAQFPDHSQSL